MRDLLAAAMAELRRQAGELERIALTTTQHTQWKRCRHCLGTIPRPRRRYCSDFCAAKGKLALQDWRRRKARGA